MAKTALETITGLSEYNREVGAGGVRHDHADYVTAECNGPNCKTELREKASGGTIVYVVGIYKVRSSQEGPIPELVEWECPVNNSFCEQLKLHEAEAP